MGLLGDVSVLGEAVCDDLHLRRLGEHSVARGLDSLSTRFMEGLPLGSLILHPSSGRLGSVHIAGVLARCPYRF